MKNQTTLKTRHADTMVKVTVETTSAVIQFSDILAAVEVVPDDMSEAPWENCDGYDHEVIDDGTDGEAVGAFRDSSTGRRKRVITSEFKNWGSAGRGAAKQVEFEAHAAEVSRTLEQLSKWHADGWQAWGVKCSFQGYEDSCWGFYDEDSDSLDMRANMREIALNVVALMEADGYEVKGKPARERISRDQKLSRIRYNMSLQNFRA